jgi:hypothetical protein
VPATPQKQRQFAGKAGQSHQSHRTRAACVTGGWAAARAVGRQPHQPPQNCGPINIQKPPNRSSLRQSTPGPAPTRGSNTPQLPRHINAWY